MGFRSNSKGVSSALRHGAFALHCSQEQRHPAAPAGSVRVEIVKLPETDTTMDLGHFVLSERIIRLKKGMRREQQWHTLYHEIAHVWLADSGIGNGLDDPLEEALCDAISTGMMRLKFG